MTEIRTAVITVNYKGARDTENCINSLKESTVPVQVVVVDNTPFDPELEAVLRKYPDVKFIQANNNLGFGGGNNLGIEWVLNNVQCDFTLILNNDAMILPDSIELIENAMDLKEDVAIVAPRIVFAEEPSKLWYGGGEVDWKRGGGKVPGVLASSEAALAMTSRYITFASGCALLIRNELLKIHGGFDERFFMYEEDLELSLRVQKLGWNIWYEPSSLVYHIGQGSLRKDGEKFSGVLWPSNPNLPFYVYNIVRNRLINMHMYAEGKNKVLFYLFFPLLLVKMTGRYVIAKRWDGVRAIFQAFISFIRLQPK